MPLFEYEKWDGPIWDGIDTIPSGLTVAPKEAQVASVPNMDDLGSTHYIWCTDEWRTIEPGDTYKGRVIIPEAPDPLPLEKQFVGGMRLIRGWNVMPDGTLRSISAAFEWRPGISMQAHEVPRLNGHHCGFFGFTDWDFSSSELQYVPIVGTYFGWGRSVKATKGFRCEWARIESLVWDASRYESSGEVKTFRAQYERVAEKYGVPVVSKARAEKLKYGIIPLTEDKIK